MTGKSTICERCGLKSDTLLYMRTDANESPHLLAKIEMVCHNCQRRLSSSFEKLRGFRNDDDYARIVGNANEILYLVDNISEKMHWGMSVNGKKQFDLMTTDDKHGLIEGSAGEIIGLIDDMKSSE